MDPYIVPIYPYVSPYNPFKGALLCEWPQVKTYFESIDLDVWDAWTFFKLLAPLPQGLGVLRFRGFTV